MLLRCKQTEKICSYLSNSILGQFFYKYITKLDKMIFIKYQDNNFPMQNIEYLAKKLLYTYDIYDVWPSVSFLI